MSQHKPIPMEKRLNAAVVSENKAEKSEICERRVPNAGNGNENFISDWFRPENVVSSGPGGYIYKENLKVWEKWGLSKFNLFFRKSLIRSLHPKKFYDPRSFRMDRKNKQFSSYVKTYTLILKVNGW